VSLKETKKYLKNIEEAKGLAIKVGVQNDAGFTYPSGATVQEVAAKHEFGLGVPRRSFLREPFLVKQKEVQKFMRLQFKKVVDGLDADIAMGLVGVKLENIVKDAFSTGGFGEWKDIAERTKDAKGGATILVDKGVLRGSITSVVVKG
jgi:hypothetical protein